MKAGYIVHVSYSGPRSRSELNSHFVWASITETPKFLIASLLLTSLSHISYIYYTFISFVEGKEPISYDCI